MQSTHEMDYTIKIFKWLYKYRYIKILKKQFQKEFVYSIAHLICLSDNLIVVS